MIQSYHKISLVENRGELVYHKLMKKVLTKELTLKEAIAELNKKHN